MVKPASLRNDLLLSRAAQYAAANFVDQRNISDSRQAEG